MALEGTAAHSLINTFADEECTYFPFPGLSLITHCSIQITGTAIRYVDLSSKNYFEAIGVATTPPGLTHPAGPTKSTEPQHAYSATWAEFRVSPERADAYQQAMPGHLARKVEKLIIDSKGSRFGFLWGFRISNALSPEEAKFVRWYLENYTDYQPEP